MTQKAAFDAEQWTAITTAPVLTALLVAAADRGGAVRESVAASRAFATARADEHGELLQAILATPPTLDASPARRTPDVLRDEAPQTLRRAIAALERVATGDEVVEYKRLVYAVAETVARAHREGGFLGIGGTEISEPEQAVLDEIAAIFDRRQAD